MNHSPRRRVHPALWITPLAIAGGLLVIAVTVVVALMAPWWMAAAQERDAQERTAQRDARVAAAAPAAHRRLHAELETYSYPAGWEYRFEQDTDRLPQVTRTFWTEQVAPERNSDAAATLLRAAGYTDVYVTVPPEPAWHSWRVTGTRGRMTATVMLPSPYTPDPENPAFHPAEPGKARGAVVQFTLTEGTD